MVCMERRPDEIAKVSKERLQQIGNGGLSGQPIKNQSTRVIKYLSENSQKAFPIIGVGGIHSAKDAIEKLPKDYSGIQTHRSYWVSKRYIQAAKQLKGKIYDEAGCYGEGDLLINTPDHTHTPRTMSEDCLCLSVLTAPLKFKKGLTRLLNPLQHLFY